MPRGRPRIHGDHAARSRAYRQRRKAANQSASAAGGDVPPVTPSPARTPRAHSEPVSEEDYVLSSLFWRGVEWAGLRDGSVPSTPFQEVLTRVTRLIDQDADLAKLLDGMSRQLNPIDLLTAFLSFFPGPHSSAIVPLPRSAGRSLTPREGDVLRELARNRGQNEVAKRLGVKESTVRSHINHIHEKLDASTTLEAVFKAAALGEANIGLLDVIESLREGFPFDYRTMTYRMRYWHDAPRSEAGRKLSAFGTLLLLVAAMDSYIAAGPRPGREQGAVLEYSPGGQFVRRLDGGGSLGLPGDIAVIPTGAQARGFQPGHLLMVDIHSHPDALNHDRIVEWSSDGRLIRGFTGGESCLARLGSSEGMAFAGDKSLLVGSCIADAVMALTDGGSTIRPFIRQIPYGGVAVDPHGRVLLVGGWGKDSRLQIFSSDGSRRLKEFGAGTNITYFGVAADNSVAYLGNHAEACVEVYSTFSTCSERVLEPIRRIAYPDLQRPYRLALAPGGPLYVLDGNHLEREPTSIHAFLTSTGQHLSTIFPPPDADFCGIAASPDGGLYVTARIS